MKVNGKNYPIYEMENKNVPNHQPEMYWGTIVIGLLVAFQFSTARFLGQVRMRVFIWQSNHQAQCAKSLTVIAWYRPPEFSNLDM